jgi:hypothetical protein
MVGIFNKVKNFFTSLPSKAAKYAPQFFGKLSDVLDSEVARRIVGLAEPVLNSVVPSLGTGLTSMLPQILEKVISPHSINLRRKCHSNDRISCTKEFD